MIALGSLRVTELARDSGEALCGGYAGPRPSVYVAEIRLHGLTEDEVKDLRALIGERLSVSRAKGGAT